jgi:hypothetical protein
LKKKTFCDFISTFFFCQKVIQNLQKSISLKTNNFTLDIEFQSKNEIKFLTLHKKREKNYFSFSLKHIFYASLQKNFTISKKQVIRKVEPKRLLFEFSRHSCLRENRKTFNKL